MITDRSIVKLDYLGQRGHLGSFVFVSKGLLICYCEDRAGQQIAVFGNIGNRGVGLMKQSRRDETKQGRLI